MKYLLALLLLPTIALADDWQSMTVVADKVSHIKDCSDRTLAARKLLESEGVYTEARVCFRNQTPHVYVYKDGMVIDNSSPRVITEEQVNCDK